MPDWITSVRDREIYIWLAEAQWTENLNVLESVDSLLVRWGLRLLKWLVTLVRTGSWDWDDPGTMFQLWGYLFSLVCQGTGKRCYIGRWRVWMPVATRQSAGGKGLWARKESEMFLMDGWYAFVLIFNKLGFAIWYCYFKSKCCFPFWAGLKSISLLTL